MDNISDYDGNINNLFESFNVENEEIVLIGQLNHNLNWDNPEEEIEKLKNNILNDINNKKNNNNIIHNIFLLQKSQKFFYSKLKLRRNLLIKEISKKK